MNHVVGIHQITQRLKQLSGDIRKEAELNVVRAGASAYAKEVRKRAPVKTGNLRKSVVIRKVSKRADPNVEYVVTHNTRGRAKHNGWYAHLVEFGTRPHEIKNKTKGGKKVMGRRGEFGSRVEHPGARAWPFWRPAFEAGTDNAIRAMARRLETFLKRKGVI